MPRYETLTSEQMTPEQRVDRVVHQVKEDLEQEIGVAPNTGQRFLNVYCEFDLVAQQIEFAQRRPGP